MGQPNPFMETFTGLRPALGAIEPSQVDPEDIVVSLSRMPRFLGHTRRHYTVGEHSVHVARLLEHWGAPPRLLLAGLLHDAKEAYVGDMPTPLKAYLRRQFGQIAFDEIKDNLELDADRAICIKMGGGVEFHPQDMREDIVVEADITMLAAEAYHLVDSRGLGWRYSAQPRDLDSVPDRIQELLAYDTPPTEQWVATEFMLAHERILKMCTAEAALS